MRKYGHTAVIEQLASEGKKTLIDTVVGDINVQDLGNPSSRQDAVLLVTWFEAMLKQLTTGKTKQESTYPLLQLVLNICIHELARQVSVQCVERGLLLKRIFSCFIRFQELINTDQTRKRKELKRDYALKLDRFVTLQDYQVNLLRDQITQLEAENRLLMAEKEELFRQYKEQN
jgi:hypothetical protein